MSTLAKLCAYLDLTTGTDGHVLSYSGSAPSKLQLVAPSGGGAAAYAGISMAITTAQNIASQTATDILWNARVAATADVTHTDGTAGVTIVSAGKYKLSGVIHLNLTGNTSNWAQYQYKVYADAVVITEGFGWGYRDVSQQVIPPMVISDCLSLTAGMVIKVVVTGLVGTGTFDVVGLAGGQGSTTFYLEYQGA